MKSKLFAAGLIAGIAISAAHSFGDTSASYTITGYNDAGLGFAANEDDSELGTAVASVNADKSTMGTGSSQAIGIPFNGSDSVGAIVEASAAPGALHLYAAGLVSASDEGAQEPGAQGHAGGGFDLSSVEAMFSDTMTVTSKSKAKGANLTVHGSFVIENSSFMINVDQDSDTNGTYGDAMYKLYLQGNGAPGTQPIAVGQQYSNPAFGQTLNELPDFAIPVTFTVQSGMAYSLQEELTMTGNVSVTVGGAEDDDLTPASLDAVGIADFSHSALWQGIQSVTDDDGDAVTDYSVTSASGFDYTQPATDFVPEPSALALVPIVCFLGSRKKTRGKVGGHSTGR